MSVNLLGEDAPRASTPPVLSVSQLNARAKELLEGAFGEALVEGEVSFWRTYPSGHAYFDLKDAVSKVSGVMFALRRRSLRFEPQVGMRVLVRCRVTLYERDGRFQVSALSMEPMGEGALEVAFRQLHERLDKEGLFAPERKKEVPARPRRVALVTSTEGAVLRDMLRVFAERAPIVELIVLHTAVQGEEAAASIAAAIRHADEELSALGRPVDLIIAGRGGGSREDLWAFNEEEVVRAIAGCATPVLSAVGHEVDTSLADLAADEAAATPTAAAERAAAGWQRAARDIGDLLAAARRAVAGRLETLDAGLARLRETRAFRRPEAHIEAHAQRVDALEERMRTNAAHRWEVTRARLEGAIPRLRAASPAGRIARGAARLEEEAKRLGTAHASFLRHKAGALGGAVKRLELVSPLRVLARGYALAYREADGALIENAAAVSENELVRVRLARGGLLCRVAEVFPEGERS